MKTFEKSVKIKCEIQDLFNFHTNTNNLKSITPPDTKVELITKDLCVEKGAILKLKTTKHFITTIWEVKIEKIEKPNLLLDVAIKSPFSYWEHSHIFELTKDGCLMKDIVKYKLPFGFIGEMFDFIIKKELNGMFEFRHKVTKKKLECC